MHKGKMEQILLAYGLPKEIVTAIMMLYKNMKAMVCLPKTPASLIESLEFCKKIY